LNEKGVVEGLENLPVVREFVNVFPEELLGFPSERELVFTIDLKSRNKNITRTPYQMSNPKLQELKMKLKELLDLGLILLSVPPWGAPVIFHTKEGWVVETLLYYRQVFL
jgi:hypothetical protein